MDRIMCTLAYDGTAFHGYQRQHKLRTVQGEIEKALKKIHKGEEIITFASGRTDTHVHAEGQVIHFDTPLQIQEHKWKAAFNTLLPADIYMKDVKYAHANFHARYDVTKKEYRYRIFRQREPDIFRRNFLYHFPYPLNLEAMREAAAYLIGTHDFTAFCSTKAKKGSKVRTLYEITLTEENGELTISYTGSGFLHNMVRILTGTLLNVGQEKISASDVKTILVSKQRNKAGKTIPGHGLCLCKVWYE